MEVLNEVWVWILSALGGVSLSGIISAVIYACLKGAFNKTINKINVQKIAEQATEKGVEKVKEVSFKHSIQPLVESGLQKVNEKSNEYIDNALEKVYAKLDKIILIQEKQAEYFDNSIGVPETKKEELKEIIRSAKEEPSVVESVVVEEVIEPTQKVASSVQKTAKNTKTTR